jgi:hypothetical protein
MLRAVEKLVLHAERRMIRRSTSDAGDGDAHRRFVALNGEAERDLGDRSCIGGHQ